MYADRLNQLDFRVGKLLRFGGTRAAIKCDDRLLNDTYRQSSICSVTID